MMMMMMVMMMMTMMTAGWREAGNCRDLLLDKLQQLQPVFRAQIHSCLSYTNTFWSLKLKYTLASQTQIHSCPSYTNTLLPLIHKYTLA